MTLERLTELERLARRLEPDAATRQRDCARVFDYADRYLERVASAPAFEYSEDRAAGLFEHPIGDDGIGLDAALDLVERHVDHEGIAPASGRFAGYIPGGGLLHAALGDFLAAVSNRYAGVFFADPGAVRIESLLVRWMAGLAGLPASASGYLSAGGSGATLSAVVTAREACGIDGERIPRAVVYTTTETHHCVGKALQIAGLGRVQRREVAVDEGYRMRPDALAAAIDRDRAGGLAPWLLVASAGTTNTGAVDPLPELAEIARRAGLWLHVDAAYG
ncbi:MAG: aminotransferase class V-fold PLP-dependent enzyme, partial [Wenzhouxiangellaceae bacterium]|nr:aminotransferase class V-fold PLP-dependent enzyme [Wenzhouxiangellaceae bacterium]